MRSWWHDWRHIIDICRSMPSVMKAQRSLGRARQLQSAQRYNEAFSVALSAFGVLSRWADKGNPPVSALVSTEAVLLDELATQVGRAGAACEELRQALRICEDLAVRSRKPPKQLQQYIAWYKQRLAEQPEGVPH